MGNVPLTMKVLLEAREALAHLLNNVVPVLPLSACMI